MGNHETIDGAPLPIDMEHLSTYTANDPVVTREVLALFRDQGEVWITALRQAADLGAWADTVHTMKGASRGVGALELAELAEEAEAVTEIDSPERHEIFARIEQALDRATRYAAQLLEDSPFVG